jgi:Domain of Unknown Function (DUF1080)
MATRLSATRLSAFLVAATLLVCTSQWTSAQAPAPARPWRTLLDVRSMDQFVSVGTADWRVADDVVKASSGTGFLVSREVFGDFELRAEFWASPDANSGIFIRCSDPQVITAANAYEVNIFDRRPDPAYRTGGIVNVAKVVTNIDAGNQWSTMEVTARGPKMSVRINGVLVAEGEDGKFARGPIALQRGAGEIRFRKVEIR